MYKSKRKQNKNGHIVYIGLNYLEKAVNNIIYKSKIKWLNKNGHKQYKNENFRINLLKI